VTEGAIPAELKYTKSHEWVRADGEVWTVGITDHAQSELTDIVYVDLNLKAKSFRGGDVVLVLESVKTVADVYAPVDGELVEVNGELKAHPEHVNRAPYAEGWIFKIRPTGGAAPGPLLSADEYRAFLASGG
jgi:glycine cleavage system H protein